MRYLPGDRIWRFTSAHSQYGRSFVAALTFEDEEMKDAEHLDAAVNEIFEVHTNVKNMQAMPK